MVTVRNICLVDRSTVEHLSSGQLTTTTTDSSWCGTRGDLCDTRGDLLVGSYPLSSLAPTQVEVELGCDKMSKPGIERKCECCVLNF